MRGGVADEAAHVAHFGIALQRRCDEVPAAVARAVADDFLGDRNRYDVWPQRLPCDGIDLFFVERAADGDNLALVFVIESLLLTAALLKLTK